MLKFNQVTKKFGDIVALEDITFDIEEGEFVFITGPSGAGKTTLLRLLLREMKPDEGEIFIEDTDITKLKPKQVPSMRQKMGVVFQDFKILPERTLRENIEIALAVIGLDKKEWRSRVDRVLDLVELTDRDFLFPSQLSGGELQRVSLARALVVNPKIILADEPTGNLDWETADKIMDLFERINKEGKTVIMATHHQVIVDKMKKRTINVRDGRLEADDSNNVKSKKPKKSDKVNKDEKSVKDDEDKEDKKE